MIGFLSWSARRTLLQSSGHNLVRGLFSLSSEFLLNLYVCLLQGLHYFDFSLLCFLVPVLLLVAGVSAAFLPAAGGPFTVLFNAAPL